MDPYPPFTDLNDNVPVILVGRVLACVPVGTRRPSIWDRQNPYQRYRVTVAVENVLKGAAPSQTAIIYFMVDLLSSGPVRLGMLNHGGRWQIGDREMFFLQHDSGRLRTICDTWAHCVVPVLSGSHENLQPDPNPGKAIADILFTRGKGASDAQMVKALDYAATFGFRFAPEYSINKLEGLIQTQPDSVRQAACEDLRMLSRSGPYSDPYSAKLLAAKPQFQTAIASCPADKQSLQH